MAADHPVLRCADVQRVAYRDADRELFDRLLRDFVPPDAFDAHAHLYDLRHLAPTATAADFAGDPGVTHEVLVERMGRWMGDRVIKDGLYFPFPMRHVDCEAANAFLANTLADKPGSRGLMLIRPTDSPEATAAWLDRAGFVGFKVYHVFAARTDTFHAEQGEFLPEWAWELADQRGLCIMMHMVLPRALSDPRNQEYIRRQCLRYPNARLILAHAARGFNARHTVDAAGVLRGLPNVWCDTSVVCEPAAFEALLETLGPSRLMYGSDFPVSEMRGRSLSIGDGFYWLHDDNAQWSGWQHATPQLVGIESLLALRQACRTLKLVDRDVERVFGGNARQLLGLEKPVVDSVHERYREAKRLIPGGTQLLSKRPEMFAPGRWPAYYEEAIGCEVVDSDGRRYLDMSYCGILSCILGFADPDVNAAVIRRVHLGSMATQQTADEIEVAKLLVEIHPWAHQARFTRGGGEAMSVAARIARAATGRGKIALCGYHGWHDWYLAANLGGLLAPSGAVPNAAGTGAVKEFGSGSSAGSGPGSSSGADATKQLDGHLLPGLEPTGVPRELAGTVATFRYNRLDELDAALNACGDDLAAIVMEPTRSVDPAPGFLEGVRERATARNAALIFDEISSAWRLCLGGAHRLYGVEPDIAVFAKAISNGFAMGAVIGRESFMSAAQGSFISSTYWTEGIGPAAAAAAIRKMRRIDVPAHLKMLGTMVMDGWRTLAEKHRIPVSIAGRPASCSLTFAHPSAAALQTLLTDRMLDHGILAAGSCSLTLAHAPHHIERYLRALDAVFAELADAMQKGDVERRLSGPVKHSTFRRLVD